MSQDPHQAGFIPLDELYNIFSNALNTLDNKVWVDDGPMPRKVHIVEFVTGIRLQLIKRAKVNLDQYLIRHPVVLAEAAKYSRQKVANKEAISQPDSREEFMKRKDRFNRT